LDRDFHIFFEKWFKTQDSSRYNRDIANHPAKKKSERFFSFVTITQFLVGNKTKIYEKRILILKKKNSNDDFRFPTSTPTFGSLCVGFTN
jgi:hypothetical protein